MDINDIISKTIDNLKSVYDDEEILGEPVISADGSVILPVVKLSYGFVVGGGTGDNSKLKSGEINASVSGAGMTVTPIGFFVSGKEKKFISVEKTTESKWTEFARTAIQTLKGDADDE